MIVKETDKELELIFRDERPTIFMLIKEELDKMPEVLIAAWREDHPLMKNIHFYIRTDGIKKPRDVLIEAIQKCMRRVDEFSKEFEKILK